jgi:hypothetical protein
MRVTNIIPLWCSLLLPIHTANCVHTLQVPTYKAVIGNAHTNNACAALGGKGHFNDADMLEIGNGALTLAEARTCGANPNP